MEHSIYDRLSIRKPSQPFLRASGDVMCEKQHANYMGSGNALENTGEFTALIEVLFCLLHLRERK
jgi:hypothetical protein